MDRTVAGALLLLQALFVVGVVSQVSIPAKYDGFFYSGGGAGCGSSVVVDAFLDPLCPDSRDSWPPLKDAVEYYSPHISVIVHPFPLPYHSNAFFACRALHIANKLNSSSTFPLLELFFKYQERYYNGPTENMTRISIIADMVKFASPVVGSSLLTEFQSGFKDSKTDSAARTSFKYGCSRGVAGAPFFFVNGFLLPGGGSSLDFQTWKRILGPLLQKHQEPKAFVSGHRVVDHGLIL